MAVIPCLVRSTVGPELRSVTLGHSLLDDYLEFVAARARPNTLLAVAYDLKVFFTVIGKEPADITTGDVLDFIKAQRTPRLRVPLRPGGARAGDARLRPDHPPPPTRANTCSPTFSLTVVC